MNIKQAIVFAILMEHDEGILNKSASYILEKVEAVRDNPHPEQLLDMMGQAKLNLWAERWKVKF